MTFLEKIKTPHFWTNVTKITIPFFLILVVITLLISSFKDITSFNFEAVAEKNFNTGKWKKFFGIKIVFSFLYGVWVTAKKTK